MAPSDPIASIEHLEKRLAFLTDALAALLEAIDDGEEKHIARALLEVLESQIAELKQNVGV